MAGADDSRQGYLFFGAPAVPLCEATNGCHAKVSNSRLEDYEEAAV